MAKRDVILSLSKDPLTSILSPGGERKTKVLGNHRGKEGDFSFSGGGLDCRQGVLFSGTSMPVAGMKVE
jgi:hypothetical protein